MDFQSLRMYHRIPINKESCMCSFFTKKTTATWSPQLVKQNFLTIVSQVLFCKEPTFKNLMVLKLKWPNLKVLLVGLHWNGKNSAFSEFSKPHVKTKLPIFLSFLTTFIFYESPLPVTDLEQRGYRAPS